MHCTYGHMYVVNPLASHFEIHFTTMSGYKRSDLSLKDKIAVLDKITSMPPGTSQRKCAELIGLPKSTIARYQKDASKLRAQWETETLSGESSSKLKRHRDGKNPEVETALNMWFKQKNEQGVSISGPLLMAKAKELSRDLGHEDFSATSGWLNRWKVRHQILYKRAHGEKNSADIQGAQEWLTNTLPSLLESFSPSDIYNADETGLYYRATPDGRLCYSYEKISGSKKSMDRLTVLCCANMSGCDKLRLLVIGKSKNPRCFKGIDMKKLPVNYKANKNAWMTSAIFEEWLQTWNKIMRLSGRSILLLVDNCSAHPKVNLSNIRLEFLPPNTTSIIQPMDQGIIRNLKGFYRSELVKLTLNHLDSGNILPTTSANEISSKVSILEAITLVTKSWEDVKRQTICNCFRKGGFVDTTLSASDDNSENDEAYMQLPVDVINSDAYMTIDDNLNCYADISDTDDIVEGIVAKRPCLDDDSEAADHDEEDDDPAPPPIAHKTAKACLNTLQTYMLQQGFDLSSSLFSLQDQINARTLKCNRQVTLDGFFSRA